MHDPLGLEDDEALPAGAKRKPGRPPGAKNKPKKPDPVSLHADPIDPEGLPGIGLSMKIGEAVLRGNSVKKPPKPKPPLHWNEKGPREIPLTPIMPGHEIPEWEGPGPEPMPSDPNPWPEGSSGWERWNNWLDEHYPSHSHTNQKPVFESEPGPLDPKPPTPSEKHLKENPPPVPVIVLPMTEMYANSHMNFGHLFS